MSNKCRPLSEDEIAAVLGAARRSFSAQVTLRNVCLLVMQLRTGFRISELLSLRLGDVVVGGRVVDHIRVSARFMKGRRHYADVALDEAALEAVRRCVPDYDPARVHIVARRQVDRPRAKTREVPLHAEARQVLEAYLRDLARRGWQTRDVPLFLSRQRDAEGRAKAIDRRQAWRIVRQLRDWCRLQGAVGTHSMRKSFTARLLSYYGHLYPTDGSKPLLLVQKALGHASLATTVRYTEVDEVAVRRGFTAS